MQSSLNCRRGDFRRTCCNREIKLGSADMDIDFSLDTPQDKARQVVFSCHKSTCLETVSLTVLMSYSAGSTKALPASGWYCGINRALQSCGWGWTLCQGFLSRGLVLSIQSHWKSSDYYPSRSFRCLPAHSCHHPCHHSCHYPFHPSRCLLVCPFPLSRCLLVCPAPCPFSSFQTRCKSPFRRRHPYPCHHALSRQHYGSSRQDP